MRNNKKLISFGIALSVIVNMVSLPIFADTLQIDYNSTVEGAIPTSVQSVPVDVEKAEVYCVKLPKSVTLSGDSDSPSYEYTVDVSGEISDRNFVRVIPLDGSYIETEEGVQHDLTVTQVQKKFTATEVLNGTITTGTMTAVDLNPGKYLGDVKFFISLDDGYFYKPATCTTGKLKYAQDINDNGVQDEGEALAEPIAVSKPLGHTCIGEHTFKYTCDRCTKEVYEITNEQELLDFSAMSAAGNTFNGIEINLLADLDMKNYTTDTPFTPIGSVNKEFRGIFNGNGHYIKRIVSMNAIVGNYNNVAFFGLIAWGKQCTIKNLIMKDINCTVKNIPDIISTVYGAALLGGSIGPSTSGEGDNSINILNCRVSNVKFKVNGSRNIANVYTSPYVGEAVGYTVTDIKNCCATEFFVEFDASNSTKNYADLYMCKLIGYDGADYSNCVISNTYSNCNGNVIASITNHVYRYLYATGNMYIIKCNNLPYSITSDRITVNNCVGLTDDELKEQTGVDLLNTGYTTPVWKVDLEDQNGGYPIQISLS